MILSSTVTNKYYYYDGGRWIIRRVASSINSISYPHLQTFDVLLIPIPLPLILTLSLLNYKGAHALQEMTMNSRGIS